MEKLDLYNKVREVPKDAQKEFNNGSFKGTDINPMWRIKTLTENFGPAGFGWYIDEIERWSEVLDTDVAVYCKIHLFVKDPDTGEWSKPIVGIGGSRSIQQFNNSRKVSDEGYKMAYTDAISVACKALGFGADIYWQTDPTKYTQPGAQGETKPRQTKTKAQPATGLKEITRRPEDADWVNWLVKKAAEGFNREQCEAAANTKGRTVPADLWEQIVTNL